MTLERQLNIILNSFKIEGNCIGFTESKSICCFNIELKPGTRIKSLQKFLPEISLALKVPNPLTLQIINGQGLLRLQYLKEQRGKIGFYDLAQNLLLPAGKLMTLLGETLEGEPLFLDLAKCPNLLVGGTTGSGKTTVLHTIIANMLFYHQKTRLLLMDPKSIEFVRYSSISNVAFDFFDCLSQLEALVSEMEQRYFQIRNQTISANQLEPIVLIIDEFADLMQMDGSKKFHDALCKLSQKSRAANIYVILATQRPSVNILDGTIKANFPARIACRVSSSIDSRVILDGVGAEDLLGSGDSIIRSSQHDLQRFQCAFSSPEDIVPLLGN